MKAALYACVSTTDIGPNPELQLLPLREYCNARSLVITAEHVDHSSGSKGSRPEFDRLLDAARKRQIDVIVIWKLNLFGKSLKHVITVLDELNALGVGFVSCSENIELSTAEGHLIGAMAEFERERVKAGIANARVKGKKLGRKPLPPMTIKKVIDACNQAPDSSAKSIARIVDVSETTVVRIRKGYKTGIYDRDGFRYEKPLVSV